MIGRRDETEVLLRRILGVNVAFLVVATAAAVALVPPLRAYLRRSARDGADGSTRAPVEAGPTR